jgi:hypothetical protein
MSGNYLEELAVQLEHAAERLAQSPGHYQQHFSKHLLEDRRTVLLLALREPAEPAEVTPT